MTEVLQQNKKLTFVCVLGIQPQVVTLAFHHLAFQRQPSRMPSEVFVVTTQEGYDRLIPLILDPQTGHFGKLLREYGVNKSEVRFDEGCVRVIAGADGQPLNDVRSDQDNQHAADQIVNFIRELTQDNERAIHLCLADGRLPMSFYAGYAMSLYGREQDELSQILVNEELSGHPEFFYPPVQPRNILTEDAPGVFSTHQAQIVMGSVPFVRLRDYLPQNMLDRLDYNFSVGETVSTAQRNLQTVKLVLDCANEQILINQIPIKLQPKALAFLWYLALRRRNLPDNQHSVGNGDNTEHFEEIYEEVDGATIRSSLTDFDEFESSEMSQLVSKIRRGISNQFGQRVLDSIGDFKEGAHGHGRYGLYGVPATNIDIINDKTGKGIPCRSTSN